MIWPKCRWIYAFAIGVAGGLPIQASGQAAQDILNQVLRTPGVQDALRQQVPGTAGVPTSRTTATGDARVREAQILLTEQGFDAGPPDGLMGRGTRRAIVAFQQSVGLPANGTLDAKTMSALKGQSETKPTTSVPLDFALVQKLLTDLSYQPGPIDGAWGRRSQDALDTFRSDTGQSVRGAPTEQDVIALRSTLEEPSSNAVIQTVPAEKGAELDALPLVEGIPHSMFLSPMGRGSRRWALRSWIRKARCCRWCRSKMVWHA
ncbi:MAG: peptidoglycan-binding domain-containing protein [Sulfitobacter sp.]